MKVLIETSARHIHLSHEHVEVLFGKGHALTPKKNLSQPGQYACEERVALQGPKGSFAAVGILGPERSASQIEVSLTDARTLGIVAPVRESGDIAGSGPCTLTGPCGSIELTEGVIAAKRHVHVSAADAAANNLVEKQLVSVKVSSNGRSLTFDDVVVRVSDKFNTAMHVDTDESNAAAMSGEVFGEIIK